jgi:hypothetical protein
MLKLLLGGGLALKDELVDDIRKVVHFVFAHPGRCAVRGRQLRRCSLRNSSGVFGCVVHVLGRRRRLSLGLAPFDAKSRAGHSRITALDHGV